MKKKSIMAALSAAVFAAVSVHASPLTGFSDITNWIGTGSNQAALIIDFNDGSSQESFAWGYRWDGTATGENMIRAIAAADSNLDLTAPGTGSGFFISSITYHDSAQIHTSDNGANGGTGDEWWTYYTADGSSSLPSSWTSPGFGAGDRTLASNSWDAWSATVDQSWPGSEPGSPQNASAVPEPSAALLLIAGIGLLTWVRKAKSSKA